MSRPNPSRSASKNRSRFLLPVLTGLAMVIYAVAAYCLVPNHELSALGQRSLGLGFALLALATMLTATRHRESAAELAYRARKAQHSDFGKELHHMPAADHGSIRLPLVGAVNLRAIEGAVVFCVAAAWWLTPWAPVHVKKLVLDDIVVPLSEELVAAVLVMPDPHMAVLQTPVLPYRAQQMAKQIPDDASAYQKALRQLALGKFDDARVLLDSARKAPGADAAQMALADAQIAMYSYRFADAVRFYEDLAKQKPDDPMVFCQLAVARMQMGDFAQAAPLVEQAARYCREKLPPSSPLTAACNHLQALVYLNYGRDFDKAQSLAHDGGEIWEKAMGEDSPSLAASRNNLGVLYLLDGDSSGAKVLFDGALDTWSKPPAAKGLHAAAALGNLAVLQHVMGDNDRAKQSLDDAAKIYQELLLPADHPLLCLKLNAEAAQQRWRARYADAQASGDKALVIAEKGLGGEHPYVAAILDNLTAICTDQAQYAKAYDYGYRANGLMRKLWGKDHPFLAMNLNELATVDIAKGKYDEAAELCKEALRIVQQAFGPKHCWVAEIQYTQGRLEIARDTPRDARPYLEQAQKIWEAALDKDHPHPQLIGVMGDIASLDDSQHKIAAGIDRAKRAVELAETYYGGEHPQVARLLCILAVLDQKHEDYADAAACLDRALAIREKALPASHPDLAATLDVYASVLRAKTPPDEVGAQKMQDRAKAIRDKHAEEDQAK
jgi:Flp pilus assembly protein TadD